MNTRSEIVADFVPGKWSSAANSALTPDRGLRQFPRIPTRFADRARSSAGEHYLDTVGVTGSIPVAPTILSGPLVSAEFLPIFGRYSSLAMAVAICSPDTAAAYRYNIRGDAHRLQSRHVASRHDHLACPVAAPITYPEPG
jgi:hypothetical protein